MRTRKSLALLTAVLVAPILSLTFPASAQAATYDGQDPIASGCASTAITARSATIYTSFDRMKVGAIELRYSTACRTAWARVIAYQTTWAAKAWLDRGAPLYGTQTCTNVAWSSTVQGYTCYTRMLNDSGTTSTATGRASSAEDLSEYYATTGAY